MNYTDPKKEFIKTHSSIYKEYLHYMNMSYQSTGDREMEYLDQIVEMLGDTLHVLTIKSAIYLNMDSNDLMNELIVNTIKNE